MKKLWNILLFVALFVLIAAAWNYGKAVDLVEVAKNLRVAVEAFPYHLAEVIEPVLSLAVK
jgi:hypothetical protein